MPPGSTPSASSEETAWAVPESLRPELARRHAPVYAGAEADRQMRELTDFSTCGDVVTANALRIGKIPFIGVVDHVTRRDQSVDVDLLAPLAARGQRKVRNPPGMLTQRLRETVREMVASGGGLLEVEGEEDLASLALVESLPSGATVIYGIPGEGASFVRVNAISKENVRKLIDRMELRKVRLGD
ncbi:MAG: DUF359 domain-containing protein [Thermoplasmata archaeon]